MTDHDLQCFARAHEKAIARYYRMNNIAPGRVRGECGIGEPGKIQYYVDDILVLTARIVLKYKIELKFKNQ